MRHATEIRARWSDVDPAGIVYYPHVFRWFDAGADELFRAVGLPWPTLFSGEGIVGLPIVEAHCRFVAPIRHGDRLRVETTVDEVRTRVFRLGHRVLVRGTGKAAARLCAEGYEIRAWVVHRAGRLHARPIPGAVRARLGARMGATRG